MKKFAYIIAALAIILSTKTYAQDERLDDYTFEQTPLQEEESPYFALGLGYAGSLRFPDFGLINKTIKDRFGVKEFNSVAWFNGIEGFTGLVFIPNLRLSVLGGSGGVKSERIDSLTKIKRTVEFQSGYTGFSFDYAYVPFGNVAIVGGSELGWGQLRLLAYQAKTEASWNGDFDPTPDADNFNVRLTRSIWHIRPHVNVEIALTRVIMFRLGAGYTYPLYRFDWELNNTTPVKDVPDKINYNGFDAQIGLFFGLFNY